MEKIRTSVPMDVLSSEQEHRRLQASLIEMNDELEAIKNSIPGGIVCTKANTEGTIISISDRLLELLGYTWHDIAAKFHNRFHAMIHPDDNAMLETAAAHFLQAGDGFTVTYRILKKDGSFLWAKAKATLRLNHMGEPYYYCVLIDITDSKLAEEALRESKERYSAVLDLNESIVFEYDFATGRIILPEKNPKSAGLDAFFPSLGLDDARTFVCPEDIPNLENIFDFSASGKQRVEAEIRLRQENGSMKWHLLRAVKLLDEKGNPRKLIGSLTDIDHRKREEESLRNRAQQDLLTSVYNKATSESLIRQSLKISGDEATHALYIIDIDDFKAINDTMGHLFGDEILRQVAHAISGQFRSADIIGRIGGDEFIVLMGDIDTPRMAEQKAKDIVDAVSGIDTRHDTRVTVSVGAAIYPQDGATYYDLFRNADSALYLAKQNRKNCYAFYRSDQAQRRYVVQPDANAPMHASGYVESAISDHILHLLYESSDPTTAIHTILALAGNYYNVSRAYVFENDDDATHCSNTFEWCNTGVASQREKLQNMSYEGVGDYLEALRDTGIYHITEASEADEPLRSLLASQGIHSLLHIAILDNGEFRGFVGFDECTEQRIWTKEEISTLTFISKILGMFLTKMRVSEQLTYSLATTFKMLDTQDMYIYAVDMATFELLFINHKTYDLVPGIMLGGKCHHAFHRRSTPCEDCPARRISQTHNVDTNEIHNKELDIWINATATEVGWTDSRRVCLVSCFDVTKYKRSFGE